MDQFYLYNKNINPQNLMPFNIPIAFFSWSFV